MPELPDVRLYVKRLNEIVTGHTVTAVRLSSPFVLRSVAAPVSDLVGCKLQEVRRQGKRLIFCFEHQLFMVIHLMIAGRLTWSTEPERLSRPPKLELAKIVWDHGVLSLIEASPKKRAGIWIVRGEIGLSEHERSGIDLFNANLKQFSDRMRASNRTLKRALTDPATIDGIGNAYSDEILFAARLPPLKLTSTLTDSELVRLLDAARVTLADWTARLETQFPGFPKPSQVTAFRPEFAVHGKFRQPCPVCQSPVQRIVGAENEINYCAKCQNGGVIYADRSLSRLLKDDFPRRLLPDP